MKEFDPKNLIASGKMHYLLRTFSKMIITSDQKLNLGGVRALITILEDPEYEVVQYLRPEHHVHILAVLKQLFNPAFRILIEKEIQIYPDLTTLISLDWKVSEKLTMPSVAIMRDCIMALLFDVRQHSFNPDCYAVSALIYATENSAYKVLTTLIDLLKQGHFHFNEQVAIPLLPIVNKRLVNEKDLNHINAPTKQAFELNSFHHLSSIFNLFPSTDCDLKKECTVHEALESQFEDLKAKRQLPRAQKILYTYKQNALVHLLLSYIELQHVNCAQINNSLTPFSPIKKNLLTVLFSTLPDEIPSKFLSKFKECIGEKLWLEENSEIHVKKVEKGVIIGPSFDQKTIRNFEGNLDSLCSALEDGRSIFSLNEGKYVVIDTLSGLQETLIAIIKQLHQEIGKSLNGQILDKIITSIQSEEFKKVIASFCVTQFNKQNITEIEADHLVKSDLLLLIQDGGFGNQCLTKAFGLQYEYKTFSPKNPEKFLEAFFSAFKEIDKEIIERAPSFLIHSKNHSFTLAPKESLHAFQNSSSFKKWFETNVKKRAKALLNNTIPLEKRKRMINGFVKLHDEIKEKLTPLIDTTSFKTYLQFYHSVLNKLDISLRQEFAIFFDKEMNNIHFELTNFQKLLKNLNINAEEKSVKRMFKSLDTRKKPSCFPYQIAYLIRKILMEENIGIFSPILIEKHILELFSFPLCIDCGDFNGYDSLNEKPYHTRLIIRYHFGNQLLGYFLRYKYKEKLDPILDYSEMAIFYPRI